MIAQTKVEERGGKKNKKKQAKQIYAHRVFQPNKNRLSCSTGIMARSLDNTRKAGHQQCRARRRCTRLGMRACDQGEVGPELNRWVTLTLGWVGRVPLAFMLLTSLLKADMSESRDREIRG